MAKLAASEASWFATWAAAQTLGGAGYVRDSPVQKWLRDAKLDEIWDGTSDIMRLIIARSLFRRACETLVTTCSSSRCSSGR